MCPAGRILVLGAGLAGLTAAQTLRRAGCGPDAPPGVSLEGQFRVVEGLGCILLVFEMRLSRETDVFGKMSASGF